MGYTNYMLAQRIKDIIVEYGYDVDHENSKSIKTTCPLCLQNDKFWILKENGACICYRGSCDFGRRWFVDWMMSMGNLSHAQAKEKLYNRDLSEFLTPEGMLKIDLIDFSLETGMNDEDLAAIEFPEAGMVDITHILAADGLRYLENRGVDAAIANHLEIKYLPLTRRVIFPVKMGGKFYGWQGRAIDKVPESERMRNNLGFRRDSLVMFADQITDHVIVCEGPINAIKFKNVGGAIATMGKVVTEKQRKIIGNAKKIYIALDDDAAVEIEDLYSYFSESIVFFRIYIPDSCRIRCAEIKKKPDFGECTYEECEQAFKESVCLNGNTTLSLYLKERHEIKIPIKR